MHEPSNDLERKLMLAADNPASRPEFYKALMASEVFVIGFTDSEGEGVKTVPAGAKLSIVNWEKNDGTPIIPFFTSLETLQRSLVGPAKPSDTFSGKDYGHFSTQ